MRLIAVSLVLALTGCAPAGSCSGTIVDGASGQPLASVGITASAEGESDLTCAAKGATSDASGSFTLEDLCSGTTYKLTLSDDSLLLDGAPKVDGGVQSPGNELRAWRAPTKDGVYLLSKGELDNVRTFSEILYETKIDDPTMKVAYPEMKPTGKVRTVEPGDYFVLSGKSRIERLAWRPLIADPEKRTFVDGAITDHVWVGVRFVSDTEWEKVEATVDSAKVKVIGSGDRLVHYIPHDALPEGRYALFGDEDKRMFVIDMGRSFATEATAEAAPAEGEAAAPGEEGAAEAPAQ